MIDEIFLDVEAAREKRRKSWAQVAFAQIEGPAKKAAEMHIASNSPGDRITDNQTRISTWMAEKVRYFKGLVEESNGKVRKASLENTQEDLRDHQQRSMIAHKFRQIRGQQNQINSLKRDRVDKIQSS